MNVKKQREQCSGCGICAFMCKKNAISMKQKEDGFVYPQIDESRCNNCGLCQKVCPFDKSYVSENTTIESYALKHDDQVRKKSSSGGFFTALSDYIMENDGIVYGAVWTEEFSVVHIRADNAVDRDRMRSSKYLQSDITPILKQLKTDVDIGRLVLFTGTPCQCAAVSRLFEVGKTGKLILMDLICHGVFPEKLFNEYLCDVRNKNHDKAIKSVNLRDKRYGWQTVGVEFSDGSSYHSDQDYFYKLYCSHAFQRPACFSCECAREERFGDFTVGDFWGCNKVYPEYHDELGVSLILVNTDKAKSLYLELAKGKAALQIKPEDYLPYQPNLQRATEKGARANEFLKYYKKHGYKKMVHRFFDVTLMRRINKLGWSILRKYGINAMRGK